MLFVYSVLQMSNLMMLTKNTNLGVGQARTLDTQYSQMNSLLNSYHLMTIGMLTIFCLRMVYIIYLNLSRGKGIKGFLVYFVKSLNWRQHRILAKKLTSGTITWRALNVWSGTCGNSRCRSRQNGTSRSVLCCTTFDVVTNMIQTIALVWAQPTVTSSRAKSFTTPTKRSERAFWRDETKMVVTCLFIIDSISDLLNVQLTYTGIFFQIMVYTAFYTAILGSREDKAYNYIFISNID